MFNSLKQFRPLIRLSHSHSRRSWFPGPVSHKSVYEEFQDEKNRQKLLCWQIDVDQKLRTHQRLLVGLYKKMGLSIPDEPHFKKLN